MTATPLNPLRQFGDGALRAPAAVRRLGPRAAALTVVYLAACAGVLLGVLWLMDQHQHGLKGLLLDYVFPDGWQGAAQIAGEAYLAPQARAVLRNLVLGGSVVGVSLLLFWLKEWLSIVFEREARLTGGGHDEFPLWRQALEELKLLVVYVTAQMLLLRLGYPPDEDQRLAARWLSHGFLAATFAIDFIAPVLQRHGLRYSVVIKILLRRPIAALSFGALFAAPGVLALRWAEGHAGWSDTHILAVAFGVQVVTFAWAALAGTWLGSQLLPLAKGARPSSPPVRAVAWVALLGLFGSQSYVFGALGVSAHHKSQLLKCGYRLDWGSLRVETPPLLALLGPKVPIGVRVQLTIDNPTAFDLVLEDSRLQVWHSDLPIAEAHLDPLRAPAGGSQVNPLAFDVSVRPAVLAAQGRALLQDRYAMVLWVRLTDDIEWPIYLKGKPPAGE